MATSYPPDLDATGLSVAVIVSRFNEFITSCLLTGARNALLEHNLSPDNLTEQWVPGAFELPLAAKALAQTGGFDCIVALGCVIRGETTHHIHVGGEAARGLAQVSLETGVPIGFGVLTTNTIEQAVARAGPQASNKGAEAALSAVEMVHVLGRIRGDSSAAR